MPPDLIRGWLPVRVKKTRQIKNLEPRSDSIGTEKALELCPKLCPRQKPFEKRWQYFWIGCLGIGSPFHRQPVRQREYDRRQCIRAQVRFGPRVRLGEALGNGVSQLIAY